MILVLLWRESFEVLSPFWDARVAKPTVVYHCSTELLMYSTIKKWEDSLRSYHRQVRLGLGTEFRSEKTPRNRLGTVSVIPRKKMLIPGHSEFRGRANSEAWNGTEWNKILRKKWSFFFTQLAQPLWSLWRPLHSILSSFLFRRMVWKGIPRVFFYFCFTERNSELFSLPPKGSEGKSESLLLFLFNGKEFRDVSPSAEGFGTEFPGLSVQRNSLNSVGNNHCSVYSVFRGIIFLPEIPKPKWDTPTTTSLHTFHTRRYKQRRILLFLGVPRRL